MYLKIYRKYNPESYSLDQKACLKQIKSDWKKYNNEWFIRFFEVEAPDLKKVLTLYQQLKIQNTPEIVENLISKSSGFHDLLMEHIPKDKYTEDEALKFMEMDSSGLLYSYLVSANLIEESNYEEDYSSLIANSTDLFFRDLSNIPVMSKEDTRNNIRMYQENEKKISELFDKEKKDKLQKENKRIRQKIVEGNICLIIKVAKKLSEKNNVPFMDLINQGCFGLFKAIEQFDLESGYQFSTYANIKIYRGIQRYIINNEFLIRKPVPVHEIYYKISKFQEQFYIEKGYEPSYQEIGDYLNMNPKSVEMCLQSFRDTTSLYSRPLEDSDGSFLDIIENEDAEKAEDFIAEENIRSLIARFLMFIPRARDQYIVELRYGLLDGKKRTLEELAAKFGIAMQRISQIDLLAKETIKNNKNNKATDINFLNLFIKKERGEALNALSYLVPAKLYLIHKFYGKNLDYLNKINGLELDEIYNIIREIKRKIAIPNYQSPYFKKTRNKPLIIAPFIFDGMRFEEVLGCTGEEKQILISRIKENDEWQKGMLFFGKNFDNKLSVYRIDTLEEIEQFSDNIKYWRFLLEEIRTNTLVSSMSDEELVRVKIEKPQIELKKAIIILPVKYHKILSLRLGVHDGYCYSFSTIAKICGISISTANELFEQGTKIISNLFRNKQLPEEMVFVRGRQ